MSETAVWACVFLLMGLGVVGSVVPGLPGAPLILGAALLHWVLLPGRVSSWTLGVLGGLCVLSFAAEWVAAAAGAKAFGGSRRAMIAAPVGALLGLPFGLFGILTGAILAAVVAEGAFSSKPGLGPGRTLLAGVGAGLGVLAGTAAKLALALAMCAWLCADFLVN